MTATRGAGVVRFTLPKSGRVTVTVAFDQGYSKRLSSTWHAQRDGDLRADLSVDPPWIKALNASEKHGRDRERWDRQFLYGSSISSDR